MVLILAIPTSAFVAHRGVLQNSGRPNRQALFVAEGHAGLQKKLDLLDELIDTLEREKAAAGDDDLPSDIEEAKQVQQMAREDYSRGVLQKALLESQRAEYCVFFGRSELDSWKRLVTEIGKALT